MKLSCLLLTILYQKRFLILFQSLVRKLVSPQSTSLREPFPTDITGERLDAGVDHHMLLQNTILCK